jgi:rhomboid protease GluP
LPVSYQWQQRFDRWRNATRGFFGGGGGDNQPRPKLCPACNSLVGINATRCHECGANLRFSLAALSKGLSGFFGGQAPASTTILIVNVAMFAASVFATIASGESGKVNFLWGMGSDALYRLGASSPAVFVFHEWFRLVTAMFLHIGILHIGMNMMVLLDVGPVVEEVYGSPRFLFLYIISGAAGFLLSAFRGSFAAGASGALMGLIGAMIAITTKRSGASAKALRGRLISWVVTIFALGLLRILPMDNWGHFGGLIAGFAIGKLFEDRLPMNSRERNRAYALGWIAGTITIVSFLLMILHYRDRLPWQSDESSNEGCYLLESDCVKSVTAGYPNGLQSSEIMDPHSIIIVSLHTPKEKLWGQLLSINPSGITMRGIDLNSFDHFISQINGPDSERTGLPTIFFPMNRVERVSLDESSGPIPSLSEMFARKVGRPISEYLSQFA